MKPVDPRVPLNLVPSGSKPVVMAETQPQFENLPSIRTPSGQVITRWEPTPEERQRILDGEDLYLTIYSYGPINPVFLSVGPCDWT